MELCDECLNVIIDNLTRQEIQVLDFLNKSKCVNSHCSLDKTKIMPSLNLTEFKFQNSMSRLELPNLICRVTNGRLHSYYITTNGKRLLALYKELLKEQLNNN